MDGVKNILLTGGSGLLGSALIELFKNTQYHILSPNSKEFNILDTNTMNEYLPNMSYDLLIHCAAYTDVKRAEIDFLNCIDININGTCNIIKYCANKNIKMIHISTEHVFDGTSSYYKIGDAINPISKYAKSKGCAEMAVRMYDNSLIIRTSFFPQQFPYDKAFIDQWSSKDYIDIIAPKIMRACLSTNTGIVHCGSDRNSIYDIAKRRKLDVIPILRKETTYSLLADTSLEINKEFN